MSTNKRKIVIIGATSAIAEQCARLWIKELPSDFVLIGRDLAKTELIAADLKVRDPNSTIECRS
jgi:decaprenylphospho-beta-D-erythro-pentofuranosid-2-ulose 2-reductase